MICKFDRSLLAVVGVLVAAGVFSAGTALAAPVENFEEDKADPGLAPETPYDPQPNFTGPLATNDLLTGLLPTTSSLSDPNRESSRGVEALTDDSITTVYGGGGDEAVVHHAYATLALEDFVTYSLGGAYNISEVIVYGGWNDTGRDHTHFRFGVSTDGGATFTDIIFAPEHNAAGTHGPTTNRVAFTDDTNPFLATGVTDVRFTWGNGTQTFLENGYTGAVEFDVLGVIPEPASVALLGLGGLAMIGRRRRRA